MSFKDKKDLNKQESVFFVTMEPASLAISRVLSVRTPGNQTMTSLATDPLVCLYHTHFSHMYNRLVGSFRYIFECFTVIIIYAIKMNPLYQGVSFIG